MERISDLNDMYYFARVVDHGTFTAAAETVGLSVSALSRRVAELERQLGVRLLNRSTRTISLSAAGQRFYERCVAVVSEAFAAKEDIDQARAEPFGLVRVSCPVAFAQAQIGDLLWRYAEQHEHVRIDLEATNRQVNVVEEGIDIALQVRVPPLPSSDLAMRELLTGELVLVASPWLIAKHGTPESPDAVSKMPTLSWSNGAERHVWQFQAPGGVIMSVSHVPKLVCDDPWLLKLGAMQGIGLAYLPSPLVQRELANGQLVHVYPEFRLPQVLYAVFPTRRGMVPAVRGVLDLIVKHCADPSNPCRGGLVVPTGRIDRFPASPLRRLNFDLAAASDSKDPSSRTASSISVPFLD